MNTLHQIFRFSVYFLSAFFIGKAWQQHSLYKRPPVVNSSIVNPSVSEPSNKQFKPDVIPRARQVTFKTTTLEGAIDKQGGHLIYLALRKHNQEPAAKSFQPFRLFDHTNQRFYIAQTDLHPIGEGPSSGVGEYRAEQVHYDASAEDNALRIKLTRAMDNGISISKVFVVPQAGYELGVYYTVTNNGGDTYSFQPYAALKKYFASTKQGWFAAGLTESCAISSDQQLYEKLKINHLGEKKLPKSVNKGWVSLSEPHFASAWIPDSSSADYYSTYKDNVGTIGFTYPLETVAPGEIKTSHVKLYAGPLSESLLKQSAPMLDRLVDYGKLFPLISCLFLLIQKFYQGLGNWGWAVVGVSALFHLLLYSLLKRKFYLMLATHRLQPKILALQARHGNDWIAFSQAKTALYRREKLDKMDWTQLVSALLQYMFYCVLKSPINEFRGAPFIGWIADLSAPDPYRVLPILVGLTLAMDGLLLKWWLPQESDPINISPFIILGLVAWFLFSYWPSAFLLYFLTQNIVIIAQKVWLLRKSTERH